MKKLILSLLVCMCVSVAVQAQGVNKQLVGKWKLTSVKATTEFGTNTGALANVKKAETDFSKLQGTVFNFQPEGKYEIDGKLQEGLYYLIDEKLHLDMDLGELKGTPIEVDKAIAFTFSRGMAKVTFLYEKNVEEKTSKTSKKEKKKKNN